MKLNLKKHLLILLCLYELTAMGQDPNLSHSFLNKLYLNPAFAGSSEETRILLNYRNQWPDMQANFVNYIVSYDQPIDILHGGIGFIAQNDRQGKNIINDLSAALIYAYKLNINRYNTLTAGFQAGYGQHTFNTSNIIYPDDFNISGFTGPSSENYGTFAKGYFDFAFGLLSSGWNYNHTFNYVIGASAKHLTEPGAINGKISRKYTAHASSKIPLLYNRFGKEIVGSVPHIVYQNQSKNHILQYGTLFILDNNLCLGFSFKHNHLFTMQNTVLSTGYLHDNYQFYYSYDFIFGKKNITFSNFGGHEVTFLINFKYKERRKKAIKCPNI
jgi:type IX secretion system PorP/SprF family membrane protein